MKKHLVTSMAIVAAAALALSACSSDAESGGEVTGDRVSGTLSVMAWGSQEDHDSIKAITDAYQKQFPDVTIDFQTGDCAIDLGVCKQLIAGDSMPDVVVPHNSLIAAEADLGILTNLDEYIEKDGLDLDQFVPASVDGVKHADSFYALPMGYHIEAMYYNKDLFDAAGLAYPPADGNYTYDDVRTWAKALTKDSAGVVSGDTGFASGDVTQWGLYNWPKNVSGYDPILLANGGSVTDLKDPTKCTLESPEAVKTFTYIQDMLFQDFSMVTAQADQAKAGKYRFANNEIGMLMGAHWMTPIMQTQGQGVNYGVAPLPRGDEGSASVVNVHSWGIYERSEAKDLGWHFIKWAATEGAAPAMGLIPANTAILDSGFLSLPDEPADLQQAFIDPASWELTVSPPEFGVHYAEFSGQDGIEPILEDIYLNTKPAAEALDGACDVLQPILDGK